MPQKTEGAVTVPWGSQESAEGLCGGCGARGPAGEGRGDRGCAGHLLAQDQVWTKGRGQEGHLESPSQRVAFVSVTFPFSVYQPPTWCHLSAGSVPGRGLLLLTAARNGRAGRRPDGGGTSLTPASLASLGLSGYFSGTSHLRDSGLRAQAPDLPPLWAHGC